MDLTVGQIVWARLNKNDIYWPGKITIISNNTNDLWSTDIHYNYHVQFFITNQSVWVNDVLPYRQYKDSMTNDSFMNYGLHPGVKQDFLNAIYQADYECNHLPSMTIMNSQQQQQKFISTMENNTDNDFLLTPAPIFTSNTDYSNISSLPINQTIDTLSSNNSNKSTQDLTINNDWYTQQGLIVESITPPLPNENHNQYDNNHFQKQTSVIIITNKSYSNSSFISYIFNSFSHFFHHSVIYIDDLNIINYQHPNTSSNIYYLICLDHFDSTIQQTLNSTILTNFNAHFNYYFLILNSPNNDLIKHFYSNIMDKRTILVLHYHSTFENEPLLLCSGNRQTYEMLRLTILRYLCSKIKYIESYNDNENEQELYSSYCISSLVQTTNVLNRFLNEEIHQTLHENFDQNFLDNNMNLINELFPQISIEQSSNNNLLQLIHETNENLLVNQSKQSIIMNNLFENGSIKTHIPPPICEYYLQNILNDK